MSQRWVSRCTVHARVIFCSQWNYTTEQEVELLYFIVDLSVRMKHFPNKLEHKAPADMHTAWALWLSSFKHYYVIVGWIPAWPASCHSNSHTSIFWIWVVSVELLCYYFSPHCKSGLDFAWHWALAWLRHGLNESKYKMQTKAILNVRSAR